MVKIKNIKIEETSFARLNNANFKKCIEYVKLIDKDYTKYLPKDSKTNTSFELTDATSDLANMIRRFLVDEIFVYSMSMDDDSCETNDRFILPDYLKKNIDLIPITQNLTDTDLDNITFNLDVTNQTDDMAVVYSRDITVYDTKQKKKLDSDKYFSGNIALIHLRPNMFLRVSEIKLTKGQARTDYGKFILLSNTYYEILDVKPLEEGKYERKGQSSLNSTPAHFKIGYTTHRNIAPKKVMNLCCDAINERLLNIQKELKNIKETDNVYFSELIELETKGDVKILHFKNEYWTISNILSKYCYLAFKDIKFVCSSIIHPSIEESIVKIRHPQAIKILTTAIVNILADVNVICGAFK